MATEIKGKAARELHGDITPTKVEEAKQSIIEEFGEDLESALDHMEVKWHVDGRTHTLVGTIDLVVGRIPEEAFK